MVQFIAYSTIGTRTAVLNVPLAERYKQEPEKVASMVMVGNLLTIVYMPVVFYFLFRM